MTTPFGNPFDQVGSASLVSTVIAEPTAGAQFNKTPLNRALGAALNSENYVVRDGALELRPVLSHMTGGAFTFPNPWTVKAPITGGFELNTVMGIRTPIASTGTEWAQENASGNVGWAVIGDELSMLTTPDAATTRWDFTQIYNAFSDEHMVVGVPDSKRFILRFVGGSRGFLIGGSGSTAYGAKCVAAFDNYLILGNTWERDSNLTSPQRIMWSDRGSASSFTDGLSGFEDLLTARGEIQRIVPLENRLLVFFDDQVWQGAGAEFPYTFRFTPLDTGVGCPYRWTVTTTPRGVMFLARDLNVYLIPKEGGTPVAVGDAIQSRLRSDITYAERAFGVYDPTLTQYELFYPVNSLGSWSRNAAFLDTNSGAWSMQSFTQFLTYGFAALDAQDQRVKTIVGDSGGTMYRLSSNYTSDFNQTTGRNVVNAFWEHMPFGGAAPSTQKSITQVRVDYDTVSASSLTVRTSPSQGVGYSTGVGLALSPTSTVSQQPAYVREASRYPAVRIEESSQSLTQRQRIHRLHVEARTGGR